MFDPSRDQVRDLFFGAWRGYRDGRPLAGLEAQALQIVLLHPEYHALLDDPERHRDRDWTPEGGATNPFLHMSLHLALEEQRAIDQPAGVRGALEALERRRGERHAALHDAMDCLAEMVWRAQRDRAPPDGEAYLECLLRRARG